MVLYMLYCLSIPSISKKKKPFLYALMLTYGYAVAPLSNH